VDAEQFGGLSDRQIVLAVLCALCAVLSHGPMLDPSEATRKPSDCDLVAVKRRGTPAGGQTSEEKKPAGSKYLPTGAAPKALRRLHLPSGG
jgi:hypothetical protein